jgi:hypothetical protein
MNLEETVLWLSLYFWAVHYSLLANHLRYIHWRPLVSHCFIRRADTGFWWRISIAGDRLEHEDQLGGQYWNKSVLLYYCTWLKTEMAQYSVLIDWFLDYLLMLFQPRSLHIVEMDEKMIVNSDTGRSHKLLESTGDRKVTQPIPDMFYLSKNKLHWKNK